MTFDFPKISFKKHFLGLEISPDAVKLVELAQGRKGSVLVKRWGTEPVVHNSTSSNDEAIAAAVQTLKQRMKLDSAPVVTTLNGPGVRHVMVKTPVLTVAETESWLVKNLSKYLPPTVKAGDIRFSFHICQEQGEHQQVLLSLARKSEVDQWLHALEPLNLDFLALSTGTADMVNSFAFSQNGFYLQTQALLHITPERTSVAICEQGALAYYQEIFQTFSEDSRPTEKVEVQLNQWLKQVKEIVVDYWHNAIAKPTVQKIVLTGNEKLLPTLKTVAEALAETEIGQPLQGLEKNGQPLPPDFALAAGLAVKGHYPLLNGINLLPPEIKQQTDETLAKQRTLKVILFSGAAFLVVWFLVNIAGYFLDQNLTSTQESLMQVNSRIVAIEKLKRENEQLSQDLKQVQSILVNRSQTSLVLHEISRIMPKNVWLRSIATPSQKKRKSKTDGDESKLILTGLAFSENDITLLLRALESSPLFDNIRLVQTERLSDEVVWKKTKIRRVGLVRFEMEALPKMN